MYPKTRELVMATVKKVVPYGAFCSLDEYNDIEAFIHVSEIAPRWIKNVHEHVKEGQKIIGRVVRVIPEKNQVDLSIKRVTDADRVWKRETYRKSKRVKNLLEIAAKKLNKERKEFIGEIESILEKKYNTSYEGLENLSYNTEDARKKLKDISKDVLDVLEKIAKENIKKQKVEINRNIILECFDSDGVEKIIKSFSSYKTKTKDVDVSIKYVGAPIYKINISAWDYKAGEKEFDSIIKSIEKTMKKSKYNLETSENE
jgi:translation initiation factor 2 subunit 1